MDNKKDELRKEVLAMSEVQTAYEKMRDERIEGMADAHEAVMLAYRKASDALDFMWEVQQELVGEASRTESGKISYARSVLATTMEMFDDEYYRIIEKAKDSVDNE